MTMRLVSRGLVLLLITTDFERLAALDRVHVDLLAGRALEAKDNLLRGLSLWHGRERDDGRGQYWLSAITESSSFSLFSAESCTRQLIEHSGDSSPQASRNKTHLLVEHRLGLATVTALLAVVTTLPYVAKEIES